MDARHNTGSVIMRNNTGCLIMRRHRVTESSLWHRIIVTVTADGDIHRSLTHKSPGPLEPLYSSHSILATLF